VTSRFLTPFYSLLASLLLAFAGPFTPSASAAATVATAKPPAPPIDDLSVPAAFTATDGEYNTGIRVSWDGVTDATYYLLYRGTTTDFSQAKLRALVRFIRFNDRQTITGENYYYWIVARNADSTSNLIGPILGIRGYAPRFTMEPVNLLADAGTNQTITAVAVGYPAVTYQWYKAKVELTDGAEISGTQTNTLSFTPLRTTDADDRYFLRIKNTTGATNSRFVRVQVIRQ
jgi:hypothetical protein